MSTLSASQNLIPVEEYLEGELRSEVKHEYLAGMVYAMAGASGWHNIIATNLIGGLYMRLRGKRCQPFGSDMKVKLNPLGTFFYYPDAMVTCDQSGDDQYGWRDRPTALFEIISESSRRVDEREKRLAYYQLDTLQAYVLIEQERPEVVVELRTPDGWKSEKLTGQDAVLRLPVIEVELPLAELYERILF